MQMLSFSLIYFSLGDLILMLLLSTVETLSSSLYIILNILLGKTSFYFELKRRWKNWASLARLGACVYPWTIMSSGDRICRLAPPESFGHSKCWQKERRYWSAPLSRRGSPYRKSGPDLRGRNEHWDGRINSYPPQSLTTKITRSEGRHVCLYVVFVYAGVCTHLQWEKSTASSSP